MLVLLPTARLLLHERHVLDDRSFVEMMIWRLPRTLPGSAHQFKYRLAYVVGGVCVLRFDNEAGKGDHRHVGETETAYSFSTLDRLIDDFWQQVEEMR
jgi:hypothetical protein